MTCMEAYPYYLLYPLHHYPTTLCPLVLDGREGDGGEVLSSAHALSPTTTAHIPGGVEEGEYCIEEG